MTTTDLRKTPQEAVIAYKKVLQLSRETGLGPTKACQQLNIRYGAFVSWHRRQVLQGLETPLNMRGPNKNPPVTTPTVAAPVVKQKRPYNKKPRHQTVTVVKEVSTLPASTNNGPDLIYKLGFTAATFVNLIENIRNDQQTLQFLSSRGINPQSLLNAKDAILKLSYN